MVFNNELSLRPLLGPLEKGQRRSHISNTDIPPMSQAASLKRRSFCWGLSEHLDFSGNQVKRSTILRRPFVFRVKVVAKVDAPSSPFLLQGRPCLPVLPRLIVSINLSHFVTSIHLFVSSASVCPTCTYSCPHSLVISLPPLFGSAVVWTKSTMKLYDSCLSNQLFSSPFSIFVYFCDVNFPFDLI